MCEPTQKEDQERGWLCKRDHTLPSDAPKDYAHEENHTNTKRTHRCSACFGHNQQLSVCSEERDDALMAEKSIIQTFTSHKRHITISGYTVMLLQWHTAEGKQKEAQALVIP